MSDRLLTVDQLAEILNTPKSWIYQQVHRRRYSDDPIPIVKLGHRTLRFKETALKQWVERRAFEGAANDYL